MSRWEPGGAYDYYGQALWCVRRFFVGPLELVELAWVVAVGDDPQPFVRTARALAPCVKPQVTETLGGVTAPAFCHHDWYGRTLADTGPHAGETCCEACGTPPASAVAEVSP